MRVKGDGIFSINTSATGGFGSAGISLPEAVVEAGGGGDTPPITTDLLVYYNPDVDVYSDAGSTLAVNGDNIRQINDQSGNNRTIEQLTGGVQPIYDVGTLGAGLGSVRVTSTNHMDGSDLIFSQPDANFSFYVVYKKSALGISHYMIGESANTRLWLRNSQYTLYDSAGLSSGVSETDNTNTTILAITVNTSGSATENRFKVYKNGSLYGQTTRDFTSNFKFNAFYGITWNSISGFVYGGNMLFYDGVHDATQVEQISDWLNDKYSIY